MRFHHSSWLFSGLLALSCTNPSPPPPPQYTCQLTAGSQAADWDYALTSCTSQLNVDSVDDKSTKDVDVLFLIDNSTSMAPKQKALAENIPRFIQQLDASGVNYHVGIATSDVGTLPPPGLMFPGSNDPRCASLAGDDGTLQRRACTTRTTNISADATMACSRLCPDPSFVPSGGAGYISKVGGVTNVPVYIDPMSGKDVGPQRAFQCMAMVGDSGCGMEGVLEGAKRALDGHNTQNSGFLRPGALLAVIIITDEDDCSVRLDRRADAHPSTLSCDPMDADHAQCFNRDYRCMARSLECDEPLGTPGTKTNCRERADSFLDPVDKYVSFFRRIRPTSRLVLRGIWPPGMQRGGKLVVQSESGIDSRTDLLNRAGNQDAACVNSEDSRIVGRAQLRLSKFLSAFSGNGEVSVCDTDRYADALTAIGTTIRTKLSARCLNLVARPGEQPTCLVGEIDASTPGAVPTSALPRCSETCCSAWAWAETPTAKDFGVSASCHDEASPCFCTVAHDLCGSGMLGAVWRKEGSTPTPGTVVKFSCASQ